MQKRIMIIEDEEAINDLLVINLQTAGYETKSFYNGLEASVHLQQEKNFDLAILDIMLPGKDGFSLLPELGEAGIPVICLTAKGDILSKVKGLKDGAEDYMVKPFEMLELLIRIEKILKRHGKEEDELSIGNVLIYKKERKVMKNNEEIYLKPMEFDCLLLLAQNKNIALTREEILSNLWGMEFEGETRTVDVHIGRIRKKLDWCRRLTELSSKIMELVGLNNEGTAIEKKRIPVMKLVENMIEATKTTREEKQIRLCIVNEGEKENRDIVIEGDEIFLTSLLINLADNAIKASAELGEITIRLTKESLTVIDRGIGIPEDELQRIMDPFYMVDKSRSRKQGGAGLGLSLCRQIAMRHNMELKFESSPGKGTKAALIFHAAAIDI